MKKYKVTVNNTTYEVEVDLLSENEVNSHAIETKEESMPQPAAAAGANGEVVKSPMPGTILSVNVSGGSSVKKGDVLFVLEAMKMENEIMAPKDGVVASVSVTQGSAVEAGTVLCAIA